ncbi:MAG: hypothetical protein ACKVT0_19725 [Planctomycetaceae bacterium]
MRLFSIFVGTKKLTVLRHRGVAWFCGASLALVVPVAIVSSGMVMETLAVEDEAAATAGPTGLQGILPAATPVDLSFDAFAVLDGNWATWSEETSAIVAKLYEETPDLAGQRDLISQLQHRLSIMEKSIADPRYVSIHDNLIDLHGKLNRRLVMAIAVIETLEANPAPVQEGQLEQARVSVLQSLDALQAYLGTFRNGDGWLTYIHATNLEPLRQNAVTDAAVLEAVAQRLASAEQLTDAAQREFFTQAQFGELDRALADYLAAANAAAMPATPELLRTQLAELVGALENYEANSSKINAETVRNVFTSVKSNAPDGGEILTAALRNSYFNYNLRIVASEAFLDHLIAEEREDAGDVVDCILGAHVTGEQTTISKLGIDLVPESNGVRFNVTLNGEVHSNTSGDKQQATIYTEGHHVFDATKEILFRDEQFSSYPSDISVSANNNNFDADTSLSGLPILRGIGRRMALMRAEQLRPEAESIAASRVSDRVLPELDKEVDSEFAKATTNIQEKLYQKLRDNDLYPSASRYVSTDTHMWVNQRLMSVGELGGSMAPKQYSSDKGLVVQIHESNMNNSLDRLNLAGRTITEDELRAELEQHFSELLGRTVTFPKPEVVEGEEPGPNTLVFAATDPVRVNISGGSFSLVLRTGFKQEGKEDIPTQEITIPMTFTLTDTQILVDRGIIAVAPVDQPESVAKQLAHSGVIRKKLDSSLPNRQFDRTIKLERKEGRPSLDLQVKLIKPLDGWLTIVIE